MTATDIVMFVTQTLYVIMHGTAIATTHVTIVATFVRLLTHLTTFAMLIVTTALTHVLLVSTRTMQATVG